MSLFRTIYEKLASAFTEDLAVLYRQRVDEISPNIRYCAYNIGEPPQSVWCFVGGIVHFGANFVFPLPHTHTHVITLFCIKTTGDQNAINDLMQMRLTGAGGGMMAEKLEVNHRNLNLIWMYYVRMLCSVSPK